MYAVLKYEPSYFKSFKKIYISSEEIFRLISVL